jgi:phage gp29-like protein
MRTHDTNSELHRQASRARQSQNPLRGLTQQRLTAMIEEAERGAQADWQWLLSWIEKEYAVLIALEERFKGALSELNWDVRIADHCPPEDQARAEEQQRKLKGFYHNCHRLESSLEELAMGRFRGCAFLEKTLTAKGRPCLEPVEPWYFCRDALGPWLYNSRASSGSTQGEPLDLARWLIREVKQPIGRLAARLFLIRSISLADWQSYLESYGIPSLIAILPPDVPADQVPQFQGLLEKLVANSRGTAPHGTTFETITPGGTGTTPHQELLDWCDKQLVLAGTGGLLTMLAESGSGTLAGGAHMDAFKTLAAREARLVSQELWSQVDEPLLDAWFPGEPHYAYFELSTNEETDPDKVVSHYTALKAAGLTIRQEQIEEKTGYAFTEGPPEEPAPPPAALPVENAAPEPAPLEPTPAPASDARLDLRRLLAEGLDADLGPLREAIAALPEDPADPAFAAGLQDLSNMMETLTAAAPGTLATDAAFEELAAAGLLAGWMGAGPENAETGK